LVNPAALEKRLRAFLKTRYRENANGYLFANRSGNPYSAGKLVEYGLWPVQDALGIYHTGTHAFRYAAASELPEEGAHLTVVQRQLRHCDAKTTLQKYGHVQIRSAVQSIRFRRKSNAARLNRS